MDRCILCWELHLNSSIYRISGSSWFYTSSGSVCFPAFKILGTRTSWKMSSPFHLHRVPQFCLANLEAHSHQVLDGPDQPPALSNVQCHTSSTTDLQLPGNFWEGKGCWSLKLSNFRGGVLLFEPVIFFWMASEKKKTAAAGFLGRKKKDTSRSWWSMMVGFQLDDSNLATAKKGSFKLPVWCHFPPTDAKKKSVGKLEKDMEKKWGCFIVTLIRFSWDRDRGLVFTWKTCFPFLRSWGVQEADWWKLLGTRW